MRLHDLHRLCAEQLRMFNTAAMTEKAHLLAMAVETAVEAGMVKQTDDTYLSHALYGHLYGTVNIGQWVNECKASLDPHSARSPGEQMRDMLAAQVENWVWRNLGENIANAIGVDYKQVASIIATKWGC